jgi:hypothetical protein
VLEESEERKYLIEDLRSKIIKRIEGRGRPQRELLEEIFKETDLDHNGEIDGKEFKTLLIKLDMGYSVKKFMKLYRAIDRDGDGSLSLTELNHLIFPEEAQKQEVEEQGMKIQSRLDRRINELESEQQQAEKGSVSLGVQRKRLGQISSLKSLSESTWKHSVGTIPSPNNIPQNSELTIKHEDLWRTNPIEKEQSRTDKAESLESKMAEASKIDRLRTQSLPPIVKKDPKLISSRSSGHLSQCLETNNKLRLQSTSLDDQTASNPRFSSPKCVTSQMSLPTSAQNSSPRARALCFPDPNESDAVSASQAGSPHGALVEQTKRNIRENRLNRKIGPSPEQASNESATPTQVQKTLLI